MITLAFDVSGPVCAVAIHAGERIGRHDESEIRARISETAGRGHAERLLPMIEEALARACLSFRQIDRIGVVVGPGSFAGIRSGVSAARGFALALDVDLVGVTAFEALVYPFLASPDKALDRDGSAICAMLDARRGEVYVACFDQTGAPLGEPSLLSLDKALDLVGSSSCRLVGTGAALLSQHAKQKNGHGLEVICAPASPDIADVARIAARKQVSGEPPKPLYIRAADARPQSGFALARVVENPR